MVLVKEEIVGTFSKRELKKANQKIFRTEKLIGIRGCKLYIEWRDYDSLFNSCIIKKDMV